MKRINALTEAAILLAVFAIAVSLSVYVPVIGIIILVALPLPLIIYGLKYEWKNGILMVAASIPIIFIAGSFTGMIVGVPAAIMGLIMGTLYKKKGSMAAVAGGAFSFVALLLIGLAFSSIFFKFNPILESQAVMQDSIKQSVQLMEELGQKPDEKKLEQIQSQINQIPLTIPVSLIAGGFMSALLIHIVSRSILRRLRLSIPPLKPFRDWKLPPSIAWYYLAVLILSYIRFEEGSYMHLAVINLFFILVILLVIQGLSFIFFYAHTKGIAKGIPIAVSIFSLFLPILLYPIQFLGIIDIGFRLREKITPKS